MKAEDENQNADEAFERELTGFRRAAPPEEWRDELIANAIPSARPARSEEVRHFFFRFSLPEKILGGSLAAAWLVIISLWIATPAGSRSAETHAANPLQNTGAPLKTEKFPMLAWRLAGDETVEELLR